MSKRVQTILKQLEPELQSNQLQLQQCSAMSPPNIAAVLEKTDVMGLKEVPMPPAPGANEVIVKMKAVGICGSDVHYWTHGAIGDFIVKAPMIIGHESAGEIVAVGPGSNLQIGDRVTLEPGVPCRKCSYCRSGMYNLCPEMRFFATPPIDGSLVTYVKHAADYCYKLPDNVSFEEGAMCEPLSVGVYACQRCDVQPESTVLIEGSGPIGLVCMKVGRAYGVSKVIITDISDARLNAAKERGADVIINTTGMDGDAITAAVLKANGGQRVDSVFECCGVESATQAAIQCCKSGGTVCIIGMGNPNMTLPIFTVGVREVDMRGIFRYRNTYPTCIKLIESGKVNVKDLITHRIDLKSDKDLIDGFTTAKTGRGNAIKVMFNL